MLALELYLDRGQLDTGDEDVVALSLLLNKLPLHTDRPDAEKFRNPNGVVLKQVMPRYQFNAKKTRKGFQKVLLLIDSIAKGSETHLRQKKRNGRSWLIKNA